MTFTELVINQIMKFLFEDRPVWGRFRLLALFLVPCALLFVGIFGVFAGPFSNLLLTGLIIYFLGFISAFVASVAYLRDIYELETDRSAFRHLITCLFGVLVPKIRVTNKIHDSDWKEMIEKIGGPAILNIGAGYAVLTETLTAPAHIYGQGGGHFISWQERVHEVIDLHEQEGGPSSLQATSRDGIEVTVENIRYNYRIWDHQWEMHGNKITNLQNPFPFSEAAIHNFVYNRTVQIDNAGRENPFSWHGLIGGRVKGIIKGYINEHLLDYVIASREHENANPRGEIRSKAYHPDFIQSLRSVGTILRWWDPGEFKSHDEIETQFLANWSVDLDSNIKLNQAYGSAQIQAYEELGRAEAEAELLMSILHSLGGIEFSADKAQSLQNLILLRTAQVIRALNTPDTSPESNKEKKESDTKDEKRGK